MKKIFSLMIFITVMAACTVLGFAAGINICIDGADVKFNDSSGAPFIDGANRTQVPLRVTMEACGCSVSWNDSTRTAVVQKNGTKVEVPIGRSQIIVNGRTVANDTAATIKNGRTYLPIRAVLEAFGAEVGWNGSTQTVTVKLAGDQGTGSSDTLLKVHFIDVGQGDAIFIDYGKTEILVDAGNDRDGAAVTSYIKPYVDNSLDYIIATHPDADHIGGMDVVINSFAVDKIIDSGFVKNSAAANDYYNAAAAEKCEFVYDNDMSINIGGRVNLKIIETGDDYDNANDSSVVSMLTYDGFKLLLTGDMGSVAEERNLSKFADVDVLKVGHHGSRYSTSAAFLNKVKPEAAVISAGKGNSYSHPHGQTLQRLLDRGTAVYGTYKSGTIVLTTDGRTYSFSTGTTLNMNDAGDNYSSGNNGGTTAAPSYIGNSNSMKFHLISCRYASSISPANRVNLSSRNDAVNKGYAPCKVCNP